MSKGHLRVRCSATVEIAARQQQRNRLLLDRGRHFIAQLDEQLNQRRAQAQLGERLGDGRLISVHDGSPGEECNTDNVARMMR